MSLPDPVVVVPGVTASVLRDEYELPPSEIWTAVARRYYDRIALHPHNLNYEAREPARVAPSHPFPLVYEDLIEELRDDLSPDDDQLVPVYPFAYDWRMPLARTESRLADFVAEVIDRTKLQRHYYNDGFAHRPKVALVGHSMGGLIIAGYLQAKGGDSVSKVVTLASPFQGSLEAIIEVATGTGNWGHDSGKARKRRAARATPALYHLLPSFPGALAFSDETLVPDIFSVDAWQPSVIRSITRYAMKWGLPTDEERARDIARDALTNMLNDAREHRRRISRLSLSDAGLKPTDWLAVVGVGAETVVNLEVDRDVQGQPRFRISARSPRNEWRYEGNIGSHATGDGTVPLSGAIPPFLEDTRVVCVAPRDFGQWELRDRLVTTVAGFHGQIANMNMLQRLIVRFLTDN